MVFKSSKRKMRNSFGNQLWETALGTSNLSHYFLTVHPFLFILFTRILPHLFLDSDHKLLELVLTIQTHHYSLSVKPHSLFIVLSPHLVRCSLTNCTFALSLTHTPSHTTCLCFPPAISISVFFLSLLFLHSLLSFLQSDLASWLSTLHTSQSFFPSAFTPPALLSLPTFILGLSVRLACLTGCEVPA